MSDPYKTNHLWGGMASALKRRAIAKITLTVFATTVLLLVANAWYAPNKQSWWGSKNINFTPVEANVCQGASQAVNITITEDAIDDFGHDATASTLVLELTGTSDVSFDETQTPKVFISGGSSEGTDPDPKFESGKLTFKYKFTVGSTTNTDKNSIIITDLYVKAANDAAQNVSAQIRVESGADFIEGLDNATDADANDGSILANIGLYPILGDIDKVTGATSINEGEVVTFSTPAVNNATKYVWDVPAEFNGGQAGVIETDLPEIKLQAEQVETSIPVVNLKVKARNDNCETKFSDDYPVAIKAVGVSITSDQKVICRTTEKRPLNSITIQENAQGDFGGKGQLVLALSDATNFALKATPTFKINGKDNEAGFAIERKNNTLVIEYDFTPTDFDDSLDKLVITGIEIRPKDNAPASTIFLRPQSVDNLKWKGVYKNTDFATLTMREVPSKANGIEVYHLGGDKIQIVALGINNATQYEWSLPIGVAVNAADFDKATIETTNTSDITVQYDDTIPDLSALTITVKGKNAECDGEVSDAEPLINATDVGVKVNFQAVEGLCVNGEAAILPKDIVCTELDNAVFREGEVTVALPTGFKLVAKPTVYFGEKDNTPQKITSVAYTTNHQGISFSLAGLENKSQKNQLTISGVGVQAVEATSSNQQVLLQAVGLLSKTLSFARFSRYEATPAPELLVVPPLLCKNTSDLTFSVKPVANMTYKWEFPAGTTITSPSSTTSEVTVSLGANFSGGTLKVTTIPNAAHTNACESASVIYTLTTPDAAKPAVTIQGSDNLFVGDQTTFEASDAQNVHEYEWTIPSGLKHASDQALVRTSSPQIVLEATSEVSNAEIKVVAVNECNLSSTSIAKKVSTTLSKPVFVPVPLNNLCPGVENVPVTLTLEEVFKQDFKGKGVLTLTPEGGNFSFTDKALVTVKVQENGSELTGNGFSAKVESNKLMVNYDFTNGDYSKINKLVIEDVPITLSNDIEAPASLSLDALVAPDGGQPMMAMNNSNVFVNIAKLVNFNTENTTVKLYEGDGTNTANPLSTLCTNAINKQYTFKVSGITGANKYTWDIPTDVFENIQATGDLVNVTLKNNPTVGNDNKVSITVQGERTGSVCKSAVVSQTIQVFTDFEADTEVGFDKSISSLCKIDGEIKSLEVKEMSGATHYQWTLPAEMETVTLDEGTNKTDNVILTSGRTLVLKVSAGFNQVEATANIKVEGLKMNPLGGCTISKTDDDLTLEVKIYGAPATPLDFSGVANGDAFVRNGSDVELKGNNTAGFFQLTDGIITKKEGGITKTFFSPSSITSLGEKTITYVYSKGGCEFSVQKTVTVSEATSTGLTTQCKTNTEVDFELPTKEDDGWLLYAVIEEMGTGGNSVITKNDVNNTNTPSPVLITNIEAQVLDCDNANIKNNISELLKLKDYGNYHYKLNPSRAMVFP